MSDPDLSPEGGNIDREAALERGAERDDWVGELCTLVLADDPQAAIAELDGATDRR